MIDLVKPFDSDLLTIKALDMNDIEHQGYYSKYKNSHHLYWTDDNSAGIFSINPYTICRNSGLKDKNRHYVFEYDLLKISGFSQNEERYGYLEWSDFYKKWQIKTSFEYGTSIDVDKVTFEVVGNVNLYDKDMKIIVNQDNVDSNRELIIDNSDCRPLHKRLVQKW